MPQRSPSPQSAQRGIRAAALLIGSLSACLAGACLLASWVSRSTGGGGYNSAVSAVIAGVHAMLSFACLMIVTGIRHHRHAESLQKLVFSCYICVTFVIYVELAAGVVFPRIKPTITPYVSAPEVGWRLRANFTGAYLNTVLKTNRDGFRSSEIDLAKPPGVIRVVCLGDSLTFGHGVSAQDTYPEQLRDELGGRMPDRQWQVINTGTEGYCTFQETDQLRRCLKYQPDMVVLLFCLNDVTEKYQSLKRFGGTGLDYHGVLDGSMNRLLLWFSSMRKFSSLITALTPSRTTARRQEAYSVSMLWKAPDAPHIGEAWAQAEKELDELRDVCRQNNLQLLIAVAPFREQMVEDAAIGRPQQRLIDYADRRQTALIDLRPELLASSAASSGVDALFLDSSHFTAEGNRVVARLIADRMEAIWRMHEDTSRQE